jgi:hypothetical protein
MKKFPGCGSAGAQLERSVPSVGYDLDATHGQNEKPVGPVARIAIEPGDVYEHVNIIILLRAAFIAVGDNGVRRGVVWVGVDIGRHAARVLHLASTPAPLVWREVARPVTLMLLPYATCAGRMPDAPELLTRDMRALGGEVAPLSGPSARGPSMGALLPNAPFRVLLVVVPRHVADSCDG